MTTNQKNALQHIQKELKAPKSKRNNFGNYNYRNCEDILEAVKPLLNELGATLILTDEVQQVGSVVIVTAKAIFTDSSGQQTIVTAHAGVDINKKGMDVAQTFGASSSYARKYALNGLFLIDDTKDYDSDEYHNQVNNASNNQNNRSNNSSGQQVSKQQNQNAAQQQKPKRSIDQLYQDGLNAIQCATDPNILKAVYNTLKGTAYEQNIINACKAKRDMEGWEQISKQPQQQSQSLHH